MITPEVEAERLTHINIVTTKGLDTYDLVSLSEENFKSITMEEMSGIFFYIKQQSQATPQGIALQDYIDTQDIWSDGYKVLEQLMFDCTTIEQQIYRDTFNLPNYNRKELLDLTFNLNVCLLKAQPVS